MKTDIHFWSYLAQFFLEWKMFQTKLVVQFKTHILCSATFFRKSCRLWDNVGKFRRMGQAIDGNIALHCFACWIPRVTNMHSEYVILDAFPLQQRLCEHAPMLTLYVHGLPCTRIHFRAKSSPVEQTCLKYEPIYVFCSYVLARNTAIILLLEITMPHLLFWNLDTFWDCSQVASSTGCVLFFFADLHVIYIYIYIYIALHIIFIAIGIVRFVYISITFLQFCTYVGYSSM